MASLLFDAASYGCYDLSAGWSSLVARWAHNPKVGGSNPPPATNGVADQKGRQLLHFCTGCEQCNSCCFSSTFLPLKSPPTPVEHSLSTTHRRRTLFPPSLMRGQEIKTQNQNQSAIYGIRSLQGGPEFKSSLEGGRYGSS